MNTTRNEKIQVQVNKIKYTYDDYVEAIFAADSISTTMKHDGKVGRVAVIKNGETTQSYMIVPRVIGQGFERIFHSQYMRIVD